MKVNPGSGETKPTFGEELRRLRKRVGLTQGELAERAGISQQSLSAIERGRTKPRPSTVFRILAQFPLEWILDDDLQSPEVQQFRGEIHPLAGAFRKTWPLFQDKMDRFRREAVRQIKEKRKAAGLTQEMLARRVGIPREEISKLERREFYGWTLARLKRVADALDIDLERIWYTT